MSDERDLILKRVKDALAPLKAREPLPEYAGDLAVMRQVVAGRDPLGDSGGRSYRNSLGCLEGFIAITEEEHENAAVD